MKKIIIIAFTSLCVLSSCDDFLEREPLDFGSEASYFKSTEDFGKAANTFYTLFPGNNEPEKDGLFTVDNNSDNQCGGWSNSDFYPGSRMVPELENSQWKFKDIRSCNYFISLMEDRMKKGEITGAAADIDHYLGEFYFFRAYEYFRLLTKLGDVPIMDNVVSNEFSDLVLASTRRPRNEVARFIISDLEKAEGLLKEVAPQVNRLNKDCAALMLARVALFEATWEKYHANTAFVPGNPKWVGTKAHPNFAFVSGSAENEINFFLDKAIEFSKRAAEGRSLSDDYEALFNTSVTEKLSEMILVKKYAAGIVAHSVPKLLAAGSNNCGYTQALVNSFLMTDGLPIYASDKYITERRDTSIIEEMKDRDIRLVVSVNKPGDLNVEASATTVASYLGAPRILNTTETGSPTGYEIRKYHVSDYEQVKDMSKGITDTPIFRVAEAYLIYLEAYYERHQSLDSYCTDFWKALRKRAGVSQDYQHTIDHTDLNKENDLAVWSKGKMVDKTLYNIRRERRCEFIAEGFRLDDLHRWRALDMMNAQGDKEPIDDGYVMRGFNLWNRFYTRYDQSKLNASGVVSPSSDGDHICPHRRYVTDNAYSGYNFPKPHYLDPIPVSEIIMTSQNSDVSTSSIYQNPGWPSKVVGPADNTFDCD
ncbi:MAG: RagB/SusD family nutrient uptake outer membrane protein [Bacteroides nordii]